DHAERVRRPHGTVRDVGRDEEGLALVDDVVDDLVAGADADLDVALQLIEVFFGIDDVEVVSRVGAGDDHDEEIAALVEVLVADRRAERVAVFLDPILQVDRGLQWHGTLLTARLYAGALTIHYQCIRKARGVNSAVELSAPGESHTILDRICGL